jgi:hypothetical protein
MHHVDAPTQVTRAVGVYEWTGDLSKPNAARLVPVSLFIGGHFEDAGVYLARPVPFAIQTGIAYEVDQAGKPLGTLNLASAKDIVTRRSAADDNPVGAWYGYGTFVLPSVTPPSNLHASNTLSPIVGSDETADDSTPHLARRAGSDSTGPATPSSPSTTAPATSTTSNGPTLSRRSDSGSTAPTTPTPSTGADDPDRPTLRHRDPAPAKDKGNKGDTGAVIPLNTSLNDDPNRPIMRHGKPLGEVSTPQLTGVPASLHQTAAVSDANHADEHIFARDWASEAEHTATLAALEALARPAIAAYAGTNALPLTDVAPKAPVRPPNVPGRPHNNIRIAPGPIVLNAPITLANEQLNAYTLSYGGLPTYVFTAKTPLPTGGPIYITLVAQRLPAGNLQLDLTSVTDASHLDRTPWFRFVDAVDADGSHRASLLFELRAQTSRQFALYRLIPAKAEQTFVTGIIE